MNILGTKINNLHNVYSVLDTGLFGVSEGIEHDKIQLYINTFRYTNPPVCFDIGDINCIPIVNDESLLKDILLPFSSCWFEYFDSESINYSRYGVYIYRTTNKQFIVLTWVKTKSSNWALYGWMAGNPDDKGNLRFVFQPTDEPMANFMQFELGNIVQFCKIMACSNITFKEHSPNKYLQKKRAKKGKLPLYSYKTLHIKVPNYRDGKIQLGGTHASPRVHIRRGHIRNYSNGKTTWVQSCVVGNKKSGIINKDYAAKYEYDHEH